MAKTGRPRVEINWVEFDKLCGIQCTLEEIAAYFRCSEDSVERACKRDQKKSFADYSRLKRGFGKISLRRKMFQTAIDGNIPLLIWLSKQHLGMTERTETKDTTPNKTITLNYATNKVKIENK